MRVTTLFLLLTLAGCNTHKMNFDCRAQNGMGCKSVSEVNETLDKPGHTQRASISTDSLAENFSSTVLQGGSENKSEQPNTTQVTRSQEQYMRIWFAAHLDEQNNYRGEQYIYSVMQPANWVAQ